MLNLFKTQLHILQLEEYSPLRFLRWWLHHPLTASISNKKPLVYTPKVRQLILLSHLLFLLSFILIIDIRYYILDIAIYLLTPFVYIILALLALKPYELINRQLVINKTRKSILTHPHLITIGITGSYGKTSTKNFLFEILNNHKATLKTPESYNTVFGIAKCINFELTQNLHYFISEMGAYKIGEIAELCRMSPPDYAILTAIGFQHLERFKTIENTSKTKFELIDHCKPQNALVNLDNTFIANNLSKYKDIKTYSLTNPKADYFVSQYTLSPAGITFTLNNINFQSKLFGSSNLQNLVSAISMAMMLKIPLQIIKDTVPTISPTPHRLELKTIGNATLIDNAYSSNEEGFRNIMSDLKHLKGKKALITPGIIELGSQTVPVHQRIGRLASAVFDTIILEGHNERTNNLHVGARRDAPYDRHDSPNHQSTSNITFLSSSSNLWPTIEKLSKTHSWILLENDLPDNY